MMVFLRLIAVVLVSAFAASAEAGPLAIAPTTVEIADGRRSAIVEVENTDDQPVDLQFEAFAWTQIDGADHMTPTNDVIVSPAIVSVAPHAKQLFRVLRTTPPAGAEQAYRLRLSQLPKFTPGGVAVNLAFVLPLFVDSGKSPAHLTWSVVDGALRVVNDGGRRTKLSRLAVTTAGDREVSIPSFGSPYVLRGSERAWPLPTSAGSLSVHVVGTTDTGPIDARATVVKSR